MMNAKLIYGCDANSFYVTKLEMHDPYVWYQDTKGKRHVLMNSLEVGRAQKFAKVDHVHPTSDIAKELKEANIKPTIYNMINWLISKDSPGEIEVPSNFPAAMMIKLEKLDLNITPTDGSFFPERAIKTSEEIELIREAQSINEKAFNKAFEVFKAAEITKDLTLQYKGETLTAEFIQGLMNSTNASFGCTSFNGGPIVACGKIGADPHNRGEGILKANEFIIIDSFPLASNFYNGDLTRTILVGEPTDWHLNVYNAVKKSQQVGLDTAKAGITGAAVHEAVNKSLEDDGFPTGVDDDGNNYGFFHGTGHALGLDVHDDGPGVSPANTKPLEENMVVTIEPGLYYPNKGGVRIEDIVAITKDGVDNLTTLPKELVIK